MEKLLTPKEVAEILDVSRDTASKLMEQMHPVNVCLTPGSYRWRVSRANLETWMARGQLIDPPAQAVPKARKKRPAILPNAYMDEYGRPLIKKNGQFVPMSKPPRA